MPLSVIVHISTCIMVPSIKHRPNKYWFAIALNLLEQQQLMYCGFLHKNCYSLPVFSESERPQNNLNGRYLSKCEKIGLQVNSNTQGSASQGIYQQKELCPTTAAPPISQDKELLQQQKQGFTSNLLPQAGGCRPPLRCLNLHIRNFCIIFVYSLGNIQLGIQFSKSYQHYCQITRRPHSP